MDPESGNNPVKDLGLTPEYIPEEGVFAYNLDSTKTPGGMRVRIKIRIETGAKAKPRNECQNKAVGELLEWEQHRQASRHPKG
jgi:hypothetical protein